MSKAKKAKKSGKLAVIWLSGNHHQVRVSFDKLVSNDLYHPEKFPIKIDNPAVLVIDCGYNSGNIDPLYRYALAGDIITLLKNRDIFDKRQRIIKLKGLPPDYPILVDYLGYTNSQNILVIDSPFSIPAKPPSTRRVSVAASSFFKSIKSDGYMLSFPDGSKKKSDAANWVKNVVEDMGKKIDPDAAKTLVDLKGSDNYDSLYPYVTLLVDYQSEKKITKADVTTACAPLFLNTVWDLLASIDRKDYDASISHLQRFYKSKSLDYSQLVSDTEMLLGAFLQRFRFAVMVVSHVTKESKSVSHPLALAAVSGLKKLDKKKKKEDEDNEDETGDEKKSEELDEVFDSRYVGMMLGSPILSWKLPNLLHAYKNISDCVISIRSVPYGASETIEFHLDSLVMNLCNKMDTKQIDMTKELQTEQGVV